VPRELGKAPSRALLDDELPRRPLTRSPPAADADGDERGEQRGGLPAPRVPPGWRGRGPLGGARRWNARGDGRAPGAAGPRGLLRAAAWPARARGRRRRLRAEDAGRARCLLQVLSPAARWAQAVPDADGHQEDPLAQG